MLSVSILPLVDKNIFNFSEDDVIIETYNAGGKGGQHSNKSDTAVRAKHKKTGIVVSINGRSQSKNKNDALKILKSKISNMEKEKESLQKQSLKRDQIENIGRSDKIRTYNFIDSRVVDHRSNKKTKQIRKVMKGRFDLIY